MILFLISFLAGVLTVLAPCVLPLLPVIVGGSLSNVKRNSKPYVIAGALAVSVIVFTLLLKVSTLFINVPESFWKLVSGIIIIVFGFSLLLPTQWEKITIKFNLLISRKSNRLLAEGDKKDSFWGDVLMGGALGPVFSSCSPTYFIILATVLPKSFAVGFVYLVAYAIGLSLALLTISLIGQKLIRRLEGVADPKGMFKRTLGVIFLLVGIAIIGGADKTFQSFLIQKGIFDPTKLEEKLLKLSSGKDMKEPEAIKDMKYPSYKEIINPSGFVNSLPFELKDIVGKKVILLDIMTYSCINCQRTFPYLNSWYQRYKDKGLEVVAIHTPEFAFEHNIQNVKDAMEKYGIKFPVVLDNDYGTWNAYENNSWPRKYLIDIDGYIRYDHTGEGNYKETEETIKKLLKERGEHFKETSLLPTDFSADAITERISEAQSREVYFGAFRNKNFAGILPSQKGVFEFNGEKIPTAERIRGKFYLNGEWKVEGEYIECQKDLCALEFSFDAKKVFLVSESDTEKHIEVYKNNVFVKKLLVKDADLYTLVDSEKFERSDLRLVISKGVKLYTFTFE